MLWKRAKFALRLAGARTWWNAYFRGISLVVHHVVL